MGKYAKEEPKLDSMMEGEEETYSDEGDGSGSSESSSSDEQDSSSEEERIKRRKKAKAKKPPDPKKMLRRNRKSAPDPKVCAALIKTTVRLNAEVTNYRPWLVSLREIAESQGWPEHIMDPSAVTWGESPDETS